MGVGGNRRGGLPDLWSCPCCLLIISVCSLLYRLLLTPIDDRVFVQYCTRLVLCVGLQLLSYDVYTERKSISARSLCVIGATS